mmetsp:Transcript_9008/g.17985  ORF Transcript_9008/g.17985 Transcript_9008/m.17985 type:complete len:317 (-) Transcript_9008:1507-2457(-)
MTILSSLLLCVASQPVLVQSFSAATATAAILREPTIPDVLNISPPAKIPPSVAIDLAADGVAVVDNYACPDTVNLLRFDALRLQYAGQDRTAGVSINTVPSGGRELRKCSQFWLQDVESGYGYLGPEYISELVTTIEDEVDGTSPLSRNRHETAAAAAAGESDAIDQIIHRQETEAAYLYYNEGGYYDWHFDTPHILKSRKSEDTGYHRRAFSFLLYLGGHENDAEPWNVEEDGGELRVYPRLSLEDQRIRINGTLKDIEGHVGDPTGRTDYTDITPQEGTLVIFKSEAICHQVLKTNRKRLVVVGWIHGDLNEYE